MYRILFALVFVMGGVLFCSPTFAQEGGIAGELLLGQAAEWKFLAVGAGLAVVGAGLVLHVRAWHDNRRWHHKFRARVLFLPL
jgi:hypothetical protein